MLMLRASLLWWMWKRTNSIKITDFHNSVLEGFNLYFIAEECIHSKLLLKHDGFTQTHLKPLTVMSPPPVPGQICAGWSRTGSARLRYWYTIVQTSSSWSFQIQRCPGFPHSCCSLRHFKGGKRGQTNLFFYVMEQANPQQPYWLIKL